MGATVRHHAEPSSPALVARAGPSGFGMVSGCTDGRSHASSPSTASMSSPSDHTWSVTAAASAGVTRVMRNQGPRSTTLEIGFCVNTQSNAAELAKFVPLAPARCRVQALFLTFSLIVTRCAREARGSSAVCRTFCASGRPGSRTDRHLSRSARRRPGRARVHSTFFCAANCGQAPMACARCQTSSKSRSTPDRERESSDTFFGGCSRRRSSTSCVRWAAQRILAIHL